MAEERLTYDQFIVWLRDACRRESSQTKLAYKIGVTPAFMSDVLNGHRKLSVRFLERLGWERVTLYQKIR